jgi:hypothetical protein
MVRELVESEVVSILSLRHEFQYAVGAFVGFLWVALPPPAPHFDEAIW